VTTQQGEPDSTAEKVERILLEARLLQRRGQSEEALAHCQEALDLDPESWEAHELAGDVLLEQGRAADALERYRAAHAIVPEQASVEEKMARATLAQAERDWLREGAEPAGEGETLGPPRNPGIAALLSLVLPGLGQGYNRQPLKAVIILGVVVLLWIIIAFQMVASLGGLEEAGAGAARVDVLEALFAARNMVWLALILLVWFYSIVDAALIAGRPAGERRDII
jgi:tetratricopeptide (TPR) repeat protein